MILAIHGGPGIVIVASGQSLFLAAREEDQTFQQRQMYLIETLIGPIADRYFGGDLRLVNVVKVPSYLLTAQSTGMEGTPADVSVTITLPLKGRLYRDCEDRLVAIIDKIIEQLRQRAPQAALPTIACYVVLDDGFAGAGIDAQGHIRAIPRGSKL